MENTDQVTEESTSAIYDANAQQRFPFVVTENGEKFDTAHKVEPVREERYLAFNESFTGELKKDELELLAETKEASADLWNDIIIEVENFELEENQTLQNSISVDEKFEVVSKLLAVAIVEPDKAAGVRRKAAQNDTQKVITEAYFNGVPVQQTHTLKAKSDEWQKKFDRVFKKQYKPETTKGLRREPKTIFNPQDTAFGKLYDEMFISSEGFNENITPLRFKTAVIRYIFASNFEEKK